MSPIIIDHELEHYVHERLDEFKAGRFTSIEDYQQAIAWQAMSEEERHEDARPKVEERLRRAHILRTIAKEQNFEPSETDIDAEIDTMATDAGDDADQIRTLFEDVDRRESLGRVLVNRKSLEFLTDIAGQMAKPKRAAKATATTAKKPAAKKAPAKKPKAPARSTSEKSGGSDA
jgi:FKBP-type peptidyl-prolyl cis-trans isomerase (trigger factor)